MIPGQERYSGEWDGDPLRYSWGFPGDSYSKEPAPNERDLDSVTGLGRFANEGYDYPLHHFCWGLSQTEQPDGLVHGVTNSRTRLSD